MPRGLAKSPKFCRIPCLELAQLSPSSRQQSSRSSAARPVLGMESHSDARRMLRLETLLKTCPKMSKGTMPRLCIVHRQHVQCMAMDVPSLGAVIKATEDSEPKREASRVSGLEPKAVGGLDEEVEDEPPLFTGPKTALCSVSP